MSHIHDLSVFNINNMTNQAFYWLGFLLADGHFRTTSVDRTELSVELSHKDVEHLKRLLNFLGREETTYSTRIRQTKVCSFLQTHVSFRIADNNILPTFVKYFDISHIKTSNPPSITNYEKLTKLQKQCILIGYIDGDGFIRVKKGSCEGKLECHSSWIDIYKLFNSILLTQYEIKEHFRKDKPGKSSVILYLSSKDVFNLYDIIKTENLQALDRKWNIIPKAKNYIPKYTQDKTIIDKDKVRVLKQQNYTQSQIAKHLNETVDRIKYLYKLLREE